MKPNFKRRKIFLHIGTRRTGTASIANFLDSNRAELAKRGWAYPTVGCWKWGHHLLPGYFFGPEYWAWQCQELFIYDNNVDRVFKFLMNEIKEFGCENIILSSPYFFYLPADAVEKLAGFLKEFDVTVVVYLRHQDQWIESLYCDAVCSSYLKFSGRPDDLPVLGGNAKLHVHPVETPGFLNYHSMLAPWSRCFGMNNVVVRKYNALKGGVLVDFLEVLGLVDSLTLKEKEPRYNISSSVGEVKILRESNRLVFDVVDYEKFKRNLKQSVSKETNATKFLLDKTLRNKIMSACQESNMNVALDYLFSKVPVSADDSDRESGLNSCQNEITLNEQYSMIDEKSQYDTAFYYEQSSKSLRSARTVLNILDDYCQPKSVVDVGCGLGTWLSVFHERGVDVLGVDGDYVCKDLLFIPEDKFSPFDLKKDFADAIGRRFDLALSLETAEHLPENVAQQFIKNLTSLSDIVMFSAAIPNQGGNGHINEQWQSYWKNVFKAEGYVYLDLIRPRIWHDDNVEFWYQHGILLYVKESVAKSCFGTFLDIPPAIMDLVHPRRYEIIFNKFVNSGDKIKREADLSKERYDEEHDRLKNLELELQTLKEEKKKTEDKFELELQTLKEEKKKTESKLYSLNKELERQCKRIQDKLNLKLNSISFRIGQAFVHVAKNPFRGILSLPYRLIKIVWTHLHSREQQPAFPPQSEIPVTKQPKTKIVLKRKAPLIFKDSLMPKLVLGITTYNRRDYIKSCLESFLKTRNQNFEWVVIVADDGSTDDTLEYLQHLKFPHELHIIKNNRRYAVGQTNTICDLARSIGFDVGFMADDDIVFLKEGWDTLYLEAIKESGYDHLCYMNYEHFMWNRRREDPNYPNPVTFVDTSEKCVAISTVHKCMGAFFSFTPRLLATVGACDEENFPTRGQWHIDYSARCCRAGFNKFDTFFDVRNSNEYIELQNNLKKDYRCSIPYDEAYKKTKEKKEIERRYALIGDESRLHIPCRSIPTSSLGTVNDFFDKIFVLNLDRRLDRWEQACYKAQNCKMQIERFPAVDGSKPPHKKEWDAYNSLPLASISEGMRPVNSGKEYYLDYESDLARVAFIEKKTGKKALASPGAWGYLKTMINVLEKAIQENYDSILVLDDDFICHKNFESLFSKMIRQLPEQWKIFQLGVLQYHWADDWITWFNKNLYHCNGSSVASHAVGIHHSAFLSLLDFCYNYDMPFDEGPLHKVTHLYADECFVCYPNLIIQDVTESDICTSGTQGSEGMKKDNVYRWRLEDYDFEGGNAGCGLSVKNQQARKDVQSVLKYAKHEAKTKVLHFRETFSAPSETFIYDMVSNLEQYTETDNYMLTFARLLPDERPFPKTISLGKKDFKFKNICEQDYKEVAEVLPVIDPDLIIAHFGQSAEVLYHAMKQIGVDYPMVVSMHGYDIYQEPLVRPEYAQIIREVLAKPNVVATYPSDYVGEKLGEYLDIPAEKTRKVNNIGNEAFYLNRKSSFWKKGESLRILNVARMLPWKGQRYLLEGFAQFLSDTYPNSQLTIVGCKDVNKSELVEVTRSLGITDKVDFRGYVPNDELMNLFRESDIYVQPSFVDKNNRVTESFGVVLLEAIFVGLPVVATDAGGMPEVIGNAPDTLAKVVAQENGKVIAKALADLYHNGGIGSDNIDYARERRNMFSLERQMRSLIQAMADVCPRAAELGYSGPKNA